MTGKKRGRPPIAVTDAAISRIEEAAGLGYTLHQIAVLIDVSDSTLDRWLVHPRIKRAYERGRLIALGKVSGTLFNLACDGDVVAAIFYLKSQFGWTDKPQSEPETGSQVVFYIPERTE
jgi:hypothetical protein